MNNLKNNIKSIALILVCIFSLASFGCGDSKPTAQTQPTTSTQAETPKAAPTPPPKQETQAPAPVEKPAQTEQRYTGQGPNGEGIKGHIDPKKGTMIYHLPGDQYYSRTKNVSKWFFTEKAAQAAGYKHMLM